MTTKSQKMPSCPIALTITLIASRWKLLIIRDLLSGAKRNGELLRTHEGLSQKVLTSTLKELEQTKLVHRTVFAEIPPRVEYSLTPLGLSLMPVILTLKDWGELYQEKMALETLPDGLLQSYIDSIKQELQLQGFSAYTTLPEKMSEQKQFMQQLMIENNNK